MDGTDDLVLVAARLNELDLQTGVGRRAAQQRLVLSGDRVRWRDDHGERVLALPGQDVGPDVPRIAAVVRATYTVLPPGGSVSSRTTVLFLAGADGRCLARIAQASPDLTDRYDEHNLGRIWPREVFAGLEARGIAYREEVFASPDACRAAYPGSVTRTAMAMGERAWWVYAGAFAVLLVVLGVAWLVAGRG